MRVVKPYLNMVAKPSITWTHLRIFKPKALDFSLRGLCINMDHESLRQVSFYTSTIPIKRGPTQPVAMKKAGPNGMGTYGDGPKRMQMETIDFTHKYQGHTQAGQIQSTST